MAIRGNRTTVTDVPTVLSSPTQASRTVGDSSTFSIRNLGPNDCELGGEDVTFGGGFPLYVGEGMDLDLMMLEILYAVCDTGNTTEIARLMTRQQRP